MYRRSLCTTLLTVSLMTATAMTYAQDQTPQAKPTENWNFQVLLDDKPIGSHTFSKYGENENYEMRIEANFEVKFLFIVAYSYEHRNREQWQDGCLKAIDSQTDDNGEMFTVQGQQEADGFALTANEKSTQLPACITTFAYWYPGFLEQTALLNSQTGEYIPVDITGPFSDTRADRGNTVQAQRYRIQAKDIDIQLWYSQAGDWLALESAVKGDRTIRYERI